MCTVFFAPADLAASCLRGALPVGSVREPMPQHGHVWKGRTTGGLASGLLGTGHVNASVEWLRKGWVELAEGTWQVRIYIRVKRVDRLRVVTCQSTKKFSTATDVYKARVATPRLITATRTVTLTTHNSSL